ncbi:uncharacterized protein LOC62_03G003860 [Vanrija pseudolonga]|uniref:Uncharacterized protein n=1 Tax=Vanrija pseudolonga TaxID=143232 RepID=A0AAF0Y4V2_9TREE|nr:hypothetical protein LOC62_03G003860 [Vanrija pseudolonga]
MRSAIHIQTGLCGALLGCTLLALPLMGYTFATSKCESSFRAASQPAHAGLAADYDRITQPTVYTYTQTIAAQGWNSGGAPVRTTTITRTGAPTRRDVVPTIATIQAPPEPTAPPEPVPYKRQWAAEPHPPLSDASVGAAVGLAWLAPLAVYLISFLVVRARCPASAFVTVLADLCFLGVFWLLGVVALAVATTFVVLWYAEEGRSLRAVISVALALAWLCWGLITTWLIWEFTHVRRRFRGGFRRSLVLLAEWGYDVPSRHRDSELSDMGVRKISLDN